MELRCEEMYYLAGHQLRTQDELMTLLQTHPQTTSEGAGLWDSTYRTTRMLHHVTVRKYLSLAVLGVEPRPRPQEQPGYGRMGVVGGQVQGGHEGRVGLRQGI